MVVHGKYGIIKTEKREILDIQGFPAFFVTNVILVKFRQATFFRFINSIASFNS